MNQISVPGVRIAQLFSLILILFCAVSPALGQTCRPFNLSDKAIERWYNPHPSPADYHLPMPLGMSLVFVPIPLGTQGLYGDEKSTYVMGSKTSRIFETKLEVRVGSSISNRGKTQFLFGKYEVSKAQYVVVMGNGILEKGAEILAERSKDPKARNILSNFISGKCKGVLTRDVYDFLTEPLTFLSYRDYIDFLDAYNLYCISKNNCRKLLSELGPNRDLPGFVRLPAEHEWEFVARGGREFAAGKMSKTEFQSDLPRVEPGTTIKRHAHIESDPPRLLPIGSKKPLFGIYDMLGNAQELMLNPFTAENGFGAVGAYVARGGHFRLNSKELRVSRRVELQAFRLDESTNSFVIQYFPLTGMRPVIGYPVIGAAEHLGDASLVQDFVENYAPPGEAGDSAGSTTADARDLGQIGEKGLSAREELSSDDKVDYFKFSLKNYAKISVSVSSQVPILFELTNESQEIVAQGKSDRGLHMTGELLPSNFWIKLTPQHRITDENKYSIRIDRNLVPDTGITRLNVAELNRADQLKTTRKYSGYVGSGDTVDTYPIVDRSNSGGIEFKLNNFNPPIELTYVDENLNIVRRVDSSSTNGELYMVLNSRNGARGFIQVSSTANSATNYNLTVTAKSPYSRIFKKNIQKVNSYAVEKEDYEGNLDDSLPALYLPIRLTAPRLLKVELTELTADVDLQLLDSARKSIRSTHIRSGTAPEFFSMPLADGIYFAKVQLKSSRDIAHFKLVYTTEVLPESVFSTSSTSATRSNSIELGDLNNTGIHKIDSVERGKTYYRFGIRNSNRIKVDVHYFLPFNEPEVLLEDQYGNLLASLDNNSSERKKTLNANISIGDYYLVIKPPDHVSGSVLYWLSITSKSVMNEPDLSSFGHLVERQIDFLVYRNQERCTMITVAKNVMPELGWRLEKPYFGIFVERGSDLIGIWMDTVPSGRGTDYYLFGSVEAFVDGVTEVPVNWDSGYIRPTYWDDGSLYVDSDSLRAFVRGQNLEINGMTPDYEPVRIEYSMLGYTNAAKRINRICRAKADWIWEN